MKRFVSILILIFCAYMVDAQVDNPLLIKANIELNKGNYTLSSRYFTSLIESNISKEEALVGRGKCNIQLKNYTQAINDFEQVDKMEKNSTLFELAGTYALMNDVSNAMKYLKEYMNEKGKMSPAKVKNHWYFNRIKNTTEWSSFWKNEWYNKYELALFHGQYLFNNRYYKETLEEMDELIDKKPQMDEAYYLRAQVYFVLEQYKKSLQDCQMATKFARKNTDYLLFTVKNQNALGKYKNALETIQFIIKINPNNILYYKVRAEIYQNLEKYEEAKADLELYNLYIKDDIESNYQLGIVQYHLKEYLNALLNFNKVLEIDPNNIKSLISRGETYLATKTYKYAERDFSMALDLDPTDGTIYYKRAKARYNLDNTTGTCSDLKKATKLGVYEAEKMYYQICN